LCRCTAGGPTSPGSGGVPACTKGAAGAGAGAGSGSGHRKGEELRLEARRSWSTQDRPAIRSLPLSRSSSQAAPAARPARLARGDAGSCATSRRTLTRRSTKPRSLRQASSRSRVSRTSRRHRPFGTWPKERLTGGKQRGSHASRGSLRHLSAQCLQSGLYEHAESGPYGAVARMPTIAVCRADHLFSRPSRASRWKSGRTKR
jgi:hypothetical protein